MAFPLSAVVAAASKASWNKRTPLYAANIYQYLGGCVGGDFFPAIAEAGSNE